MPIGYQAERESERKKNIDIVSSPLRIRPLAAKPPRPTRLMITLAHFDEPQDCCFRNNARDSDSLHCDSYIRIIPIDPDYRRSTVVAISSQIQQWTIRFHNQLTCKSSAVLLK